MLMMVVAVTAALLACTKDGRENENDDVEIEPQYAGADTMTLRVVDDGEDGTLILAGETEVYALPLDGLTLYLDGSSVSAAETRERHERRGLVHRRRAGDVSREVFSGGGRIAFARGRCAL